MTDDANWYSDNAATFGDRLAGAREDAGLTQGALAKQIGVKTATLTAWEDDVKEPRANRLQMLSGMLGVSLTWLLTGQGDGPAAPSEDQALSDDLQGLLSEMRALRSQITQSGEALGQLEKRLRFAMKDNV